MIAIYKRELRAYFHSFIGALFIGVTLFLLGIYFAVYNLFMGYPYIGYALSSVVFIFLISIPILTMRILAEERHQKTDQLILTSPVSVGGIVVGKFLAVATVFAIPVLVICFYPLILSLFGNVAFGESYLAILGFFLYGIASISVCVFISSLTESQVIAAVLSFGALFLGYVMSGLCNMISSTGNLLTKILSVFDMVSRFDAVLNGSLEISSIVYYLSVTALFLVFTAQSIQKRRYQISKKTLSLSSYSSSVIVISIAVALLINLIVAELPSKYTTFDVTENQLYSLSQESIELTEGLTEDVNIYVITSEDQADTILDTTLQNYEDLSSHIKVSYVDPAVNPKFYTKYTDSTITTNTLIVESSKRSKVVDYNNMYQSEFDYSTYSSTVTGYDGEGQITSAIAYVTSDDMPKIYILEGHGELSFDSTFQTLIEKANMEYETINLMNYDEIPADASCVVINAPTSDLSDDDTQKMLSYMEKGGDVFIISTYTGTELPNFTKILDFYGVSATKGLVIEADANSYYQDPFYLLPTLLYDEVTESVRNNGGYVFSPYSQGLTVTEKEDVTVDELLETSSQSYAREDMESSASYGKQEGDTDGPFYLGLKCVKAVEIEENAETTETDAESTDETIESTVQEAADNSIGIIYSSESLFTQNADLMVSGNNSRLFAGTISSFASEESSISIPVKSYEVEYLTIPQSTIMLLIMITVIIIPFAVLIAGFVIWFRRRKR